MGALSLCRRTLIRRLAEERASYPQILDKGRRDFADLRARTALLSHDLPDVVSHLFEIDHPIVPWQ